MAASSIRLRGACAALAFASTLLPGVAGAQESTDPIKLTLHDWTGQLITTELMGEVLKKAGYSVEYVQADYLAQFAGLEAGDLHVAMEMWETTGRDAMDAATATGKVENLGATGMKAKEEWWFPEYMKEKCPGLPNWEALKDEACAEIFSTAETAPKGRYLGGPVTWGGFDDERVAAGAALRGHPRGHGRRSLRRTRERLPARGADPAVDLRAALGAGEIQGRVDRVPGIHQGMLHRPQMGLEPRRALRLRQAVRRDLEGRLGRREGQVAGRLQGDQGLHHRQ